MHVRTDLHAGAEYFPPSPTNLAAMALPATGREDSLPWPDFHLDALIANINQRLRLNWLATNLETWRAAADRAQPVAATRVWELDALRGIAVGMMTAFSGLLILDAVVPAVAGAAWPLWWFAKWGLQAGLTALVVRGVLETTNQHHAAEPTAQRWLRLVGEAGLWTLIGLVAGMQQALGVFYLIAGMGLALTYAQATTPEARAAHQARTLGRVTRYALLGGGLTLLSLLLAPQAPILFGSLHLLGAGLLLTLPVLEMPTWAGLVGGLGIVGIGQLLSLIPAAFPWAAVGGTLIGASVSYAPLFPWLGLLWLGVYVGKRLYPHGERAFALPDWEKTWLGQWFTNLGRHALPAYLAQVPLVMLAS